MRETFFNEMMIVAVASFVMFLPIWLVVWIIFPRLDRRPKDSVRCRTCWYDLRVCTTPQCPECGADLLKTRVWPIGKPNRSRLIHLLMLWFWLGFIATVFCVNLYHEYSYDIATHYQIDQDIALVAEPKSGTHDFAVLTLGGQGWEIFPGKHEDHTIPVSWVSIDIDAAGIEVFAITFDADTMAVIAHPVPHVEKEQTRIRANTAPHLKPGTPVTPELLASFHPHGLDAETDRLLHAEMTFLIETIHTYKTEGPLLLPPEKTGKISDELRSSASDNGEYAHIARDTDYYYQYEFDRLPMWIPFVILGLGIVVIVVGVVFIRRWCYRRDTAVWEPIHDDLAG